MYPNSNKYLINTLFISCVSMLFFTVTSCAQNQSQIVEQQYGTVEFEVSCNAPAQKAFTTGLAILHHMMYEQAEDQFRAAADADPECPMAHWGIAMSVIHPLWGERPADDDLRKGQQAIATAKNLNPSTGRERAWVAAVEPFYTDWETTSYPEQLTAFEKGFEELHHTYPDDIDAAAFFGLGQLATAPRDDPEFTRQARVGAMLEELHKQTPEHPGLFHYIIHAYDNPVLADRAIEIARGYDQIAPDVPHALHMPSHIFVRVGLWPDVIDWNRRSGDAALRQPVGDLTSVHYAHALDYLMYAALQQGEDTAAKEVLESLNEVNNFQPAFGTAYAVAAVQIRYPLEREKWAEAALVPVKPPNGFPIENWPATESMLHYGRGLGAARSGDTAAAYHAIEEVDRLYDQLMESGETYWAVLTDAQRTSITAWLAFSESENERALRLMNKAAETEDSVDKHPVTPGHVLPARELLGDLLLELDRPEEAFEAYETSLENAANRFRSLYGAGRAAELAGNISKAKEYYVKLVGIVPEKETERAVVEQARQFLRSH